MKDLAYKGVKNPQEILPFLMRSFIKKRYSNYVHDSAELKSIANNCWEIPDNTEGLSISIVENIAQDDRENIRNHFNFVFRDQFVCDVSDVVLLGPYAAGKTPQNKYIEDMIGPPSSHGDMTSEVLSTLTSELNPYRTVQSRSSLHLGTAAVIHRPGGSQNFYHWMIDQIPKLRGVELYEKQTKDDVTLIVPEYIPSFAKEAINLLGFGSHTIVEWKGRRMDIDTLIVPSWPEPTPGNLHWMKSNVESTSNRFNNKEWVYISRQKSNRRKVANFDDLMPILDNFGVDIIYCEDYSLEEQIELFRSVDGIIGPHGAGLTGMIWADTLSIIELHHDEIRRPFYIFADLLGHEYSYLMGEKPSDQKDRVSYQHDIIIDPDNFEDILKKKL